MMPTKEQIEAIIRLLTPILRLSNREIDFDYCDQYCIKDLTGKDGSVACCDSTLTINHAHIYLCSDTNKPQDWYNSLVHELFHLVTSDYRYHAVMLLDYIVEEKANLKEKDVLCAYYEQLVDSLAKIFCIAYPESNFNQILEETK